MHVKCSSCHPLLHGHGAHPLPRGHPLIMVEKLEFQPVIVELCGLSHAVVAVGDAGDEAEVAVDDPADPR